MFSLKQRYVTFPASVPPTGWKRNCPLHYIMQVICSSNELDNVLGKETENGFAIKDLKFTRAD